MIYSSYLSQSTLSCICGLLLSADNFIYTFQKSFMRARRPDRTDHSEQPTPRSRKSTHREGKETPRQEHRDVNRSASLPSASKSPPPTTSKKVAAEATPSFPGAAIKPCVCMSCVYIFSCLYFRDFLYIYIFNPSYTHRTKFAVLSLPPWSDIYTLLIPS